MDPFNIVCTTKVFKENFEGQPRKFQAQEIPGIEIEIEQLTLQLGEKETILMERPCTVEGW